MEARYVFAVRFRLDPTVSGVDLDPQEFETRLARHADPPGEDGWQFFRDNLWRGAIGDGDYFRTVTSVEYRAFETDEEYYTALKAEIRENLTELKADSVSEVITKYLGSSVEVEQ